MSELRVVVSGAGKMGRQVAAAVAAEEGMTPVAFLDGLATTGKIDHLPVYSDVATCFDDRKPDVVIDFTNAAWTPGLATAAMERNIRLVIGTTGLPEDFLPWLEKEAKARKTGAVVAANFAIGAVLMMHFARQAARFFDNAEIIELHHDQKVDAPSGTAKTTAELMRAARETRVHLPTDREGDHPGRARRGARRDRDPLGSSARAGRAPGGHLRRAGPDAHASGTTRPGADSFMPGVIIATREVMKLDHLAVGLDALFGLQ